MIGGVLYVVLIYLQPAQQDALRRYENLALPVFRRHGGRFERILSPVRVPGALADPEAPDEIHLLRFETAVAAPYELGWGKAMLAAPPANS